MLRQSDAPMMGAAAEERTSALLAAGDFEGAATTTLRQHGPAVHRFLGALLGDWSLAGDAHSLFCEWVWRDICTFRGRSSLRAWCFGVAVNAARRVREDPWRRRARRLSTSGAAAVVARASRSSGEALEARAQLLEAVRAELPEQDRTLLALRLDRALGWREIEAILRSAGEPVSAATLRKRYERLRERLKELLEAHGLLP